MKRSVADRVESARSSSDGTRSVAAEVDRNPVEMLHRVAGNQAVQRLHGRAGGRSGDGHEREADRVAETVTGPGSVESGAEHPGATAKEPTTDGSLARTVRSLTGGGRPLPPSTRSTFEPRFGRDFGGVRIHYGPRADAVARAVGARAFTTGRDVVFARGEYDTGSTDGRRLLAHELTHVVQQGGARSGTSSRATEGTEPGAVDGGHVRNRTGGPCIQRQQMSSEASPFAVGAPSGKRKGSESDAGVESVRVVPLEGSKSPRAGQAVRTGVVVFPRGVHEVGEAAGAVGRVIGDRIVEKIRFYEQMPGNQTARIKITGSASGEWRSEKDLVKSGQLNLELARQRAAVVRRTLREYLAGEGVSEDAYSIAIDTRVGSRDPVQPTDRHALVSLEAQTVSVTPPPSEPETEDGPYDDHLLDIAINNVGFRMISEQLVKSVSKALPGVGSAIGATTTAKVVEQLLKVKDIDDELGNIEKSKRDKLKEVRRRVEREYERLLELNPSYKSQYCRHRPGRGVCN